MQVTDKINSVRAARAAFLAEVNPAIRAQYRKGKPHNQQSGDVRTAWDYWLMAAVNAGRCTDDVANYATL